jgi:hypothetical protein
MFSLSYESHSRIVYSPSPKYQGRDQGEFNPGTIVAIVSPPFVENWLGETSKSCPLPLLDVPGEYLVTVWGCNT